MQTLEYYTCMLEPTTIKQTALDYFLSNLEVLPEDRHLFEVVGATHFNNNEWMINISIVDLVGKYWNIIVDGNTGKILYQNASFIQTAKT